MRLSVRISWITACIIYFLLIVVEWSVGEKTVPFCLLKCKDEHMMKMDREWSMDFAFPLLSLLRTNGSEEAAYIKATQICFHNEMLGVCINKCNASDEREIMQIGLEPWNKICSNLRTLRTQFTCWKFHIETLTLACFVESHRLRMSLRQLTFSNNLANVNSVCQQMQILASCTVEEYGKQCGVVTTKLLASLFDSAHNSMIKMLNKKWKDLLPTACTQNTTYEFSHLRSVGARLNCFELLYLISMSFILFKLCR